MFILAFPRVILTCFCLNTSNIREGESRKESGHTICMYLQVATLPILPYRFTASSVAQSKFISSVCLYASMGECACAYSHICFQSLH